MTTRPEQPRWTWEYASETGVHEIYCGAIRLATAEGDVSAQKIVDALNAADSPLPPDVEEVLRAMERGHPVHSWRGNERLPDRTISALDGREVSCWGCAGILSLRAALEQVDDAKAGRDLQTVGWQRAEEQMAAALARAEEVERERERLDEDYQRLQARITNLAPYVRLYQRTMEHVRVLREALELCLTPMTAFASEREAHYEDRKMPIGVKYMIWKARNAEKRARSALASSDSDEG